MWGEIVSSCKGLEKIYKHLVAYRNNKAEWIWKDLVSAGHLKIKLADEMDTLPSTAHDGQGKKRSNPLHQEHLHEQY